MLDWLIEIDRDLLLLCNGVHTPWLDSFFWIMSERWLNIFVALPLLVILFHGRVTREAVLLIAMLVLTVALCDQIASSVFKPLFQRLRPTHDDTLAVVIVNGYKGGRYGFISSHAANAFGVATLLLSIFRNRFFTFSILLWATIVSYSRIFLGVHFPGDVLCGALVGVLVGCCVYRVYNMLRIYMYRKGIISSSQNPYILNSYAHLFAFAVLAVIVIVAVVSLF